MLIETERLQLRPHCPQDLDGLSKLLGSSRSFLPEQWLGARFAPADIVDLLAYLMRRSHLAALPLIFAIENRSPQRYLGLCGFHDQEGGVDTEYFHAIDREFRRQGVATEAAAAALEWSRAAKPEWQVVARVHVNNLASQAVFGKLGLAANRSPDARGYITFGISRATDPGVSVAYSLAPKIVPSAVNVLGQKE